MKIKIFACLFAVYCLSSCYAFLKADKLVYSGTFAKKPSVVTIDSVYQVEVQP